MRRVFARVALMVAAMVVLLIMVRVVGGTARNSLAMMFTEIALPDGEKQACWHAICPGQTALDDARRILAADSALAMPDSERFPLCWESHTPYYVVCLGSKNNRLTRLQLDVYFQFNPIEIIDSRSRMKFLLGDLVALWGNPVGIDATRCEMSSFVFENNGAARILWVRKTESGFTWTLDPNQSEVASILLTAADDANKSAPADLWKGFITTSRMACR